jgi:hypothetical protein
MVKPQAHKCVGKGIGTWAIFVDARKIVAVRSGACASAQPGARASSRHKAEFDYKQHSVSVPFYVLNWKWLDRSRQDQMDSSKANRQVLAPGIRIARWTLTLPLASLAYCLVLGAGAGALILAGIAKFEAVKIDWVESGLIWLWFNLASFVFVLVGSSIAPCRKLLVACVLAVGIMALPAFPWLGQLVECLQVQGLLDI